MPVRVGNVSGPIRHVGLLGPKEAPYGLRRMDQVRVELHSCRGKCFLLFRVPSPFLPCSSNKIVALLELEENASSSFFTPRGRIVQHRGAASRDQRVPRIRQHHIGRKRIKTAKKRVPPARTQTRTNRGEHTLSALSEALRNGSLERSSGKSRPPPPPVPPPLPAPLETPPPPVGCPQVSRRKSKSPWTAMWPRKVSRERWGRLLAEEREGEGAPCG